MGRHTQLERDRSLRILELGKGSLPISDSISSTNLVPTQGVWVRGYAGKEVENVLEIGDASL